MAAFLEDYTMLDEIGSGGYATVYKVRHNQLDYIRAIRVLDKTISSTKDKLYLNFLEECKLLLRLGNGNHPNIVHIYQPLLKANKALVEMDFIDGQDLTHYLEKKKRFVEIEEILQFVEEIGSALAYCHHEIYKFCYDKERDKLDDDPQDGTKPYIDETIEKRLVEKYRVIHNDIHSGNIMRREDGHYVLLDFGLAIEGSNIVRSSKRRNGAPEYKSPEKWDNEDVISTESDIYSFGIVLYEYLTGRVPFPYNQQNSNQTEAEYELLKAHKTQAPPSICEIRKEAFERINPNVVYKKDYPKWLETLILKCLEKNPKKRFKNGKDLYEFVKRKKQKSESSQTNNWRFTKILEIVKGNQRDPFFDEKKTSQSSIPKKNNTGSEKKSGDPFFDKERTPPSSKNSIPRSKKLTGDPFFDNLTSNKKNNQKNFFEEN